MGATTTVLVTVAYTITGEKTDVANIRQRDCESVRSAGDMGSPNALGPAGVLSIPWSVSGQELGHLN